MTKPSIIGAREISINGRLRKNNSLIKKKQITNVLSRSLFHCTQYRSANLNRDSLKERNQYVKNKILNDGGLKTKNKIKDQI